MKITKKDEEIFNCIKDYILKNGFPPSIREIGDMTGLKSTASVHGHLQKLQKAGYILSDVTTGCSRAIKIRGMQFHYSQEG